MLLSSVEVRRLHKFGYYHGDLHRENIILKLDGLYATTEATDKSNIGKAFIIDFGRTLPEKSHQLPQECKIDFNSDDCITNLEIFKTAPEKILVEGNPNLKSKAKCDAFIKKMEEVSKTRKDAIFKILGITRQPRSIAQVISRKLDSSGLIFSGGGKVKKPNLRKSAVDYNYTHNEPLSEEAQLLCDVIINSLRQNDTYQELHQFLVDYYDKYDAPNMPNTKHSVKQRTNPIIHTQGPDFKHKITRRQFPTKPPSSMGILPPPIPAYGGGITSKNKHSKNKTSKKNHKTLYKQKTTQIHTK
jgi:hypothetical protein